MITFEMRREAEDFLIKVWGDEGKRVVEACYKVNPFCGSTSDFLSHCTACGGNWGGMLLSGMKELYPEVWDAIPNEMGLFAFTAICDVLLLCGVNTTE